MYNIRIKNMQKTKTGTQLDYGLVDRNTLFVKPTTKVDSEVKSTISAVPREEANVEAEGGETVVGDVNNDGYLEHQTIVGKRHSQGGVPLNVAPGSFIFSDTKKMKIKDEEVLSIFGLKPKAGGYTPAEIAKRYEITKFVAALKNPESDNYSKETAQIMMDSNLKKLGMLALVQESMKGFPDGIPAIAENVLAGMQGGQEMQSPGQEPEEGVEHELTEGQEEEPEMKYGGSLPKAQLGYGTGKPDTATGYWDRVAKDNVIKGVMNDELADPRMAIAAAKLNPFSDKVEGVGDYLSNLFLLPQKELNHLLTGYYESPMETAGRYDKYSENQKFWGDVATDPMMYPELPYAAAKGSVKLAGKAITKAAPYAKQVAELTTKYGKQAGQFLSQYIGKIPFEQLVSKGYLIANRAGQAAAHNTSAQPEFKFDRIKDAVIDGKKEKIGLSGKNWYKLSDGVKIDKFASNKVPTPSFLNPKPLENIKPVITPEKKEVYDQTPKTLTPQKKKQPVVKTQKEFAPENSVFVDEEFAYGGTYIPMAQVGAQVDPTKKIVKWEVSKVTGNKRPVYSDGSYGPVEKSGVEYDVADEDLRKEVSAKNYDFIELKPEFRYKNKKVGPQTKQTGYQIDPESGFLYKDIKPGAAGLQNYMEIHKEAIDAYPGGAEEWKKTMLANPGKENPAMRHLLVYENAAIGPLSNNRSYVDLNKKGAFVPGVENFNLPGIKKVVKPAPAKPVGSEQEIVPPTRPADVYKAPDKGWWLQDRLNLLAAMTDKIGRFEPAMAHFDPIAYDYALLDPTRQLAASQEQQARYKDMLMNSTAGNVGAASMIGDFGESLGKNADIIANVENANVGIYNQMSGATAAANRNLEQLNETAKQKYIEEMAVLNQNQLNDEMKKKYRQLAAFNTGHTNWTKKKQMENVLFPQYNIDPINGDVNFTGARPMFNQDGTFAYSTYAPAYSSASTTGAIDTDALYKAYIDQGYEHKDAIDLVKLKAGQYQNKRSRSNNDYTYGYDPEALMGGII